MKIMITRSRAQSAEFGKAIELAGFDPVYFPVIEIRPAQDLSKLDNALENIGQYAWVIFTSMNGVNIFFERAANIKLPVDLKIGAVGPKTADAIRQYGMEPFFIPEEFVGEALFSGLGEIRGKRVLLPRAEIARKTLPEAIKLSGGMPDEISIYQTLPAIPDPKGLAALASGVDWITFTSPSTAQNFAAIARLYGFNHLDLPGKPKIACIGPITEKAAQDEGFKVEVVADEYTTERLLNSIKEQVTGKQRK